MPPAWGKRGKCRPEWSEPGPAVEPVDDPPVIPAMPATCEQLEPHIEAEVVRPQGAGKLRAMVKASLDGPRERRVARRADASSTSGL